jgi:hypothetical protein
VKPQPESTRTHYKFQIISGKAVSSKPQNREKTKGARIQFFIHGETRIQFVMIMMYMVNKLEIFKK